jgi:hypothetical protein
MAQDTGCFGREEKVVFVPLYNAGNAFNLIGTREDNNWYCEAFPCGEIYLQYRLANGPLYEWSLGKLFHRRSRRALT